MKIIHLILIIIIPLTNLFSQEGLPYREYLKVNEKADSINKNLLTISLEDNLQNCLKVSVYNKSYFGGIGLIYDKLNKNKKAIQYLKKAVFEGLNIEGFDMASQLTNEKTRHFFIKNYPKWRKQYLEEREKCTICKELAIIHTDDQKYRKQLSIMGVNTDKVVDSIWTIIHETDISNFKKLEPHLTDIIQNYYSLTKGYETEDFLNFNLALYFGHYEDKNIILKYKDAIYTAARNGKCPWQLAEGVAAQLLFKFPFEKTLGGRASYLYDLYSKNNELDEEKSFFQMEAMKKLLKNNPEMKVMLFSFSPNMDKALNSIKNHLYTEPLLKEGVVTVSTEPFKPQNKSFNNNIQFGWVMKFDKK